MTILTVNTAAVDNQELAIYFASADRRIVSGFRLALDVLGIPTPEFATRKPAGRPSVAKLMADAEADTGNVGAYRAEKTKFIPRASRA